MNPEEEVKNVDAEKKPMRVFGEEDAADDKAPPKKKKAKSAPDGGSGKKVDKAIHKDADPEKKPVKKKKSSGKKKSSKKKKSAGDTFMRLGKGLKAGSVTVTKYGKQAARFFENFTGGNAGGEGEDIFLRQLKERYPWLRKIRFSSFIIATVLILLLTLTFFNNTNIQVENITVSVAGLSDDLEGYTICVLSDLHGREFGTMQASLLRAINGTSYDLMVLTGDMVGEGGNPQPLYDLLDGLSGNKPVYFVAGDSDPGPLRELPRVVEGTLEEFVLEDWVLGAIERGAVYLDSPESIKVDEATIWLTPESMLNVESSSTVSSLNQQVHVETNEVLEQKQTAYDALPFTSYRQQNMLLLQTSILQMETGDLHISVGHIPPYRAPRVSDGTDGYLPTVDLILAGHYCGGVWKLPLLGAVYIPSVESPRHGWFPAQSEVEGMRMLGSANLFVSGGLGVTDKVFLPDFRLNNQPKVTYLHLTAKLTDDLLGVNN
ncbi:MAG: metallophosphoesterase [Clostridia bacterium]|nr:metallophosphoesterase [Clostridia bacterium]